MALKLKSVLRSPQLTLILKALIFLGFLSLVYIGNFGIVPILFFLVVVLLLYSKPILNTFSFWVSLVVLLFFSLISPAHSLTAIFFAFLFYIILGLKNLIFVNRFYWYSVLHLLLFYSLFMLSFLSDQPLAKQVLSGQAGGFIFKSIGIFIISLFLFREFLRISAVGFPKRRLIISWTFALMVIEAIWAIRLLPIGFLNSANLALLTAFIMENLILHHFKGTLNRRLILTFVTIFILSTVLIFMTSKWNI